MSDIFDQGNQPHKEQAERTVLGCMLVGRRALDDGLRLLAETDFYSPVNQIIFNQIRSTSDKVSAVTPELLAGELDKHGNLEKVGGSDYLAELVAAAPAPTSLPYYAQAVKDAARQRKLIQVGTRIAQLGHSSDVGNVSDAISLALNEAFTLGDERTTRDYVDAHTADEELLRHIDNIQQGVIPDGVPTGFRDIDEVTRGLQPGQMVVVAGRPAMGKSTLGMDFARSAALHHDMCTVVFSLEMSRMELRQRINSADTDIPLSAFRNADKITQERWDTLNVMWSKLEDKPLYIDDSPGLNITDIRAKCRRLKQSDDLKLVVIDYLQLMSSGRPTNNRQQEVSEYSRQMKLLAKELGVPVVVLSQLNRNVEMRNDKKPQLSDLRESGSIEQDADVVFLVHRPDVYDREDRPGEADVIMAKHRNGPTDTFTLAFLGAFSKFKDMPQGYGEGGEI